MSKEYKLFGLFKNDLSLSESKKNPVSWIDDDFGSPNKWSFTFENVTPEFSVEVICDYDSEDDVKLPSVDYIILWDFSKDVILAELDVTKSGWKYL